MNWKKLLRYTFIILLVLIVAFVIWANYGLNGMYGGHIEVVNTDQFDVEIEDFQIVNVGY